MKQHPSSINAEKPIEFWIIRDEYSNMALIRTDAEKYETDVNGKPGQEWLHVIEYSAYEQVVKERDEMKLVLKNSLPSLYAIGGYEYQNEFKDSTNLEVNRRYAKTLISKFENLLRE